jgi:hypothetical protein
MGQIVLFGHDRHYFTSSASSISERSLLSSLSKWMILSMICRMKYGSPT